MLSDRDIRVALTRGEIGVDPLPLPERIQPASIDLCLGSEFMFPNLRQNNDTVRTWLKEVCISRGGFMLATTAETITIGTGHVGRIEGKSSLGRLGITAHITAGFIDPAFSGQVTLEIANLSKNDIFLKVGEPICQISFEKLDSPCGRPYGSEGLGSHYQNQRGVVPSALSE